MVVFVYKRQKSLLQIICGISVLMGICFQLLHRSLKQKMSVVQDSDVIRHQFDLRKQMGRDKYGAVVLFRQRTDQRANLVDADRIQSVGRFIQDQNRRMTDQSAGESETLLHPE